MAAELKTILYTGEQSRLELPDGLGELVRDVPRQVPAVLAGAMCANRTDMVIVDDEKPAKKTKTADPGKE